MSNQKDHAVKPALGKDFLSDIKGAEEEAAIAVREAKEKANRIVLDARRQAEKIRSEAETVDDVTLDQIVSQISAEAEDEQKRTISEAKKKRSELQTISKQNSEKASELVFERTLKRVLEQ